MRTLLVLLIFCCLTVLDAQNQGWFLAASANGFVLDQVPTNSVGAYSLRKLRTGHTGNAIRVRRSSDNAELDIGFEGNGMLNTAALLSFAGAGDAFVVTMYDQSGNSRDVVQGTASSQPKIVNAGALYTINSRVYFYNDATDFLQGPDLMGGSASEFAVCMVIQTYATSNGAFGNIGWRLRSLDASRVQPTLPWSDLNIYYDVGAPSGSNRLTVTGQFTNNTLYQFTFLNSVSGSLQAVRKNGSQVGSDATGHTVTTDYVRLSDASPQGIQGYLSEYIFFESALTVYETSIIERNQGAYFSITVN